MFLNQDIKDITKKITETVVAEKIYLFGSYAYGEPDRDSDYDIYVVIPDESIRPIEAMKKIYRSLAKTKMHTPVDVIASYKSNFDERKDLATLENKISREGVLLYERDGVSM